MSDIKDKNTVPSNSIKKILEEEKAERRKYLGMPEEARGTKGYLYMNNLDPLSNVKDLAEVFKAAQIKSEQTWINPTVYFGTGGGIITTKEEEL